MPANTTYKILSPEEITSSLQTELERLLTAGLSPDLETIARRYYSDKEREGMDESAFCGPHKSFPVQNESDFNNAVHLIGHADDPAAVKACLKRKAKANGWKLPDSWQDDNTKDRAMPSHITIDRATGNHEPMSGTHTHSHPAFGAQGNDENHEHEHSHDNDADHHHSHDEARAASAGVITQSDRFAMSLPLTRIDATKREVWGQATAEVPDSYGTIFGYCPEAWTQWRGNIREQHDPKKAVGRRLEVLPDPQERAIYVGSRISRGAQDTWLKVEDNVLTGYSASIIPDPEYGTDPRRWPKKEYNGKQYPYLPRYTVAELSLVDNPACPGCDIQIVRADGFVTDVTEEPEPESAPEPEPQPLERAGKSISAATKNKLHESIGHTLMAAKSQMQNCADAGCADCQAALKQMDPDNDGDIDAFGGAFGDTDGDASSLSDGDSDTERVLTGIVERVVTQQLAAVYARLQGIAGTLARSTPTGNLETIITGAITRAVEAANSANDTTFAEVRTELSVVKEQIERIAKTPVPGAPIQHAGTHPGEAQKRLPTDPYQAQRYTGSAVYKAIAEASASGQLDTQERQVDALAAGLLAQRGGL